MDSEQVSSITNILARLVSIELCRMISRQIEEWIRPTIVIAEAIHISKINQRQNWVSFQLLVTDSNFEKLYDLIRDKNMFQRTIVVLYV